MGRQSAASRQPSDTWTTRRFRIVFGLFGCGYAGLESLLARLPSSCEHLAIGTAGPADDANGLGVVSIVDIKLIRPDWGASRATAVIGCLAFVRRRRAPASRTFRPPLRDTRFRGKVRTLPLIPVLGLPGRCMARRRSRIRSFVNWVARSWRIG